MAVVDAPPLGSRGTVGAFPTRLDDVAGLVADLHRSGVRVERRRTPDKLLRSLRRKLGGEAPAQRRWCSTRSRQCWSAPPHPDPGPTCSTATDFPATPARFT
jgi:hypothetical protein